MTITYRDAAPIRRGRRSIGSSTPASATPSAISIGPKISRRSCRAIGARRLGSAICRPRLCLPDRARSDGEPVGLCQARADEASGRDRSARRCSLDQLYVLRTQHGAGIARGLMDWALAEAHATRRGGAVPHRVRRQSPRAALLRPLWVRGGRALRFHGRQPCRRGRDHAEGRCEPGRGHPRGRLWPASRMASSDGAAEFRPAS